MSGADYRYSKPATENLARKVERYWQGQGYPEVKAWAEEAPLPGSVFTTFVVRSNLDQWGYPPGKRTQAIC